MRLGVEWAPEEDVRRPMRHGGSHRAAPAQRSCLSPLTRFVVCQQRSLAVGRKKMLPVVIIFGAPPPPAAPRPAPSRLPAGRFLLSSRGCGSEAARGALAATSAPPLGGGALAAVPLPPLRPRGRLPPGHHHHGAAQAASAAAALPSARGLARRCGGSRMFAGGSHAPSRPHCHESRWRRSPHEAPPPRRARPSR